MKAYRIRCFCLTGEAMGARFLDNLAAITAACATEGPFIYAVHQRRIERLTIGEQ